MRMVEDNELSHDCTVAESVSEARNILGSERFDVVIADYLLGDGTAFDIFVLPKYSEQIHADAIELVENIQESQE